MKLFDSHCQLDDPVFHKDFAAVLQRTRQSSVDAEQLAKKVW